MVLFSCEEHRFAEDRRGRWLDKTRIFSFNLWLVADFNTKSVLSLVKRLFLLLCIICQLQTLFRSSAERSNLYISSSFFREAVLIFIPSTNRFSTTFLTKSKLNNTHRPPLRTPPAIQTRSWSKSFARARICPMLSLSSLLCWWWWWRSLAVCLAAFRRDGGFLLPRFDLPVVRCLQRLLADGFTVSARGVN